MFIRRSLAAFLFVAALGPASAMAQTPAPTTVWDDDTTVTPENKATARQLTIDAYTALDAKDYKSAVDRFERARKLFRAPTVILGLARAYAGAGKLVAAREAYSLITYNRNVPAQFAPVIADAEKELAALAPRVPGVVINLKGGKDPKVKIDDGDVPVAALGVKRAVDPGQHLVKVTAPGFFPAEAKFTVAEGKVETVNLELKADPNWVPPPPSKDPNVVGPQVPDKPVSTTQKTIGFVGLGVGGAALIMGAVTGGLALSKRSALLESCGEGHCPKGTEDKYQSDIDSYNTMGTLSTAGFIAGGVLAATGVVLIVTSPKARSTGNITPLVGIGYLGAQGKF